MTKLFKPGLLAAAFVLLATGAQAQGVPAEARAYLGEWYAMRDGQRTAVVEIFEDDGRLHGRVVRLLPTEEDPSATCQQCHEDFRGKGLTGELLVRNLRWDSGKRQFKDGEILNPEDARRYNSYMEMQDDGRLMVAGTALGGLIKKKRYWVRAN